MLHVLPEGFPSPSPHGGDNSGGNRLLADAVARLSVLTKVDVSENPVVVRGTPFVEIIRRARDERAELVVIGSHGQHSFGGALLGSTAERVYRKSDLPKLVVGAASQGPDGRPMVAVDLSRSSLVPLPSFARPWRERGTEPPVLLGGSLVATGCEHAWCH